MRRFVMQRIGNQPLDVRFGQRCQGDFVDAPAAIADGVQLARQGMAVVNLVAAVGAYQQQVLHVGTGQQIFQQVERCRIDPLQIIQKQRQRMPSPGEHADESPEHQQETALRLLRFQGLHGRRVTDDELQFRNQVGHQPRFGVQGVLQCIAPLRQLGVVLAQ
ncbi:hypothetical protein D3C73_735620 [compost metagenome]